MDAEEFCLRWNNHHHVLVSVLDKLLEKESMCDVTLAADHQMIRVHRLVLCACSNYFEEMLSKQIDKQAFIFLKDVKFSDLKALVDYMYKGEVNVAQDQLSSFLQTAEALDVKGLTYKDDGNDQSSKAKSSHSNSRPNKRSNNEALSSNILTTSTAVQKPDNESSNQRSKPPLNKKALITPAVESHIPLNTIDSDDNFLVVGQKFETDQNSADETMDGNGADWTQRDGEDDWSTSDPGLISIVPNSVTSTNLSQDNFGGPSVSETSIGDDSAGGAGPSGNRTSRGNNQTNVQSRGGEGGGGSEQTRYGCHLCLRTYMHKKHLNRHMRSGVCQSMKPPNKSNLNTKLYSCSSCPYTTYVKGFLRRHNLTHGATCDD